jgi:hypothetical protein
MDDPLLKLSEEILTDITEWRKAHPRAKYVEIEEEVHKRMMKLEARIIEKAAETSPSREWGRRSENPAPQCPKCGRALHARGSHSRSMQGNGGVNVTIERTYGTCPKCGEGLFPPG